MSNLCSFFEVVQIRFVLEDVNVQFAFSQSKVGAHIVGELDQFDFIAFFLQSRLDLVFYHIAEVAGSCTEDDFFFSLHRCRQKKLQKQQARCLFDHRRKPVRWRAQRLKGF